MRQTKRLWYNRQLRMVKCDSQPGPDGSPGATRGAQQQQPPTRVIVQKTPTQQRPHGGQQPRRQLYPVNQPGPNQVQVIRVQPQHTPGGASTECAGNSPNTTTHLVRKRIVPVQRAQDGQRRVRVSGTSFNFCLWHVRSNFYKPRNWCNCFWIEIEKTTTYQNQYKNRRGENTETEVHRFPVSVFFTPMIIVLILMVSHL